MKQYLTDCKLADNELARSILEEAFDGANAASIPARGKRRRD